jgi:hypothetical protein
MTVHLHLICCRLRQEMIRRQDVDAGLSAGHRRSWLEKI